MWVIESPPGPRCRHRVGGECRDHPSRHQRDEQREEIESKQRAAVRPRKRDPARMVQVEQQVGRAEQRRQRRHREVPTVPRPHHREAHGKRDAGQEQTVDRNGRERRPGDDQHPPRGPETGQRRQPPAGRRGAPGPGPRRRQQEAAHHRGGEAEDHLVRVPRRPRQIRLPGQQVRGRKMPDGQRDGRERSRQQVEGPEAHREHGHRPPPPPLRAVLLRAAPLRAVHRRHIEPGSRAGQSPKRRPARSAHTAPSCDGPLGGCAP